MSCESYYKGAPCDTNCFVSACEMCNTEYGRKMQKAMRDDDEDTTPMCPPGGDNLETCDGCGKKGCSECEEGWVTDSGDNRLCPDCAQAAKEMWARDTDNGKKVCGTCVHFFDDDDDEEYGTCSNKYSDFSCDLVQAKNYCERWIDVDDISLKCETNEAD